MVAADRGQAFALEGVVAALILLVSIVVALQMTAVTPLSSSTSNQQIEGELAMVADGVVEQARVNGTLRSALLYWDDSNGAFHNASAKGYYTACSMPGAFGRLLEQTFTDHGVACNVNAQYLTASHVPRTERVIYEGTPTDHAVRAVATLTLYDDDVLRNTDWTTQNRSLQTANTFYAPDAAPDHRVYNVIQVEVVVWRM